jgi:hypothetical protein
MHDKRGDRAAASSNNTCAVVLAHEDTPCLHKLGLKQHYRLAETRRVLIAATAQHPARYPTLTIKNYSREDGVVVAHLRALWANAIDVQYLP